MEEFIDELGILLEWYTFNEDNLDDFKDEFRLLVSIHKDVDGVREIADIIAHNYNCHKYNRMSAIVKDLSQWRKYVI